MTAHNGKGRSPRCGDGMEDIGIDRPKGTPFHEILTRRLSRRDALKGLAAGATLALPGLAWADGGRGRRRVPSTLRFEEIEHAITPDVAVAEGYSVRPLVRWGDPVLPGAPAFDPAQLTAASQLGQFGYNCDFIGYFPLPYRSESSRHGLLCVNHEYTNSELMWAGGPGGTSLTQDQVEVELAAHGMSILEVRRPHRRDWQVVEDSEFARRISPLASQIELTGPAAGHPRMVTSADPTGRWVLGMLNNCAGGKTPWGTVLTAEENFNGYFTGFDYATHGSPERENLRAYGFSMTGFGYGWSQYFDRFDVSVEPREPNRHGWIIEIDPYDPDFTPRKRTALGRLKHEGAGVVINRDGRVVVYSGDDERFEYLYKFVSARSFSPHHRERNLRLLDEGTLYAARFQDDGTLEWLPLVYGEGPLREFNGFSSQADVLIEARRAADLVGATPMDRPEEVDVNPVTGLVYAVFTNNTSRTAAQVNGPNPRGPNPYGHILEIRPEPWGHEPDHAANSGRWEVFILAGNPDNPAHGALYHPDVTENGWLAAPDNIAFDPRGRLWIATDQGSAQATIGIPDGLYGTDTWGRGRRLTRFFFRVPVGAEMCGPEFTPDGRTLFLAVQHPAEGSTFDSPDTRWPDFADEVPPRPSVVVVTKDDGGEIGD